MITPLKKNDKVMIISPSASIRDVPDMEDQLARGEKILKDLGLQVVYGENAKGKLLYKSGTREERLNDLHKSFTDPEIKAVFCTQGGENSNELLPFIDWELIRKNSKFFFGSSDITVLMNAFYAKTGILSFHGMDLLWGLGKNATVYSIDQLKALLFENKHIYKNHPDYPKWKVIRKGQSFGTCIGGCLPSFCLLSGTLYNPLDTINAPFVFIIESINESPSSIEGHLAQIFQHPNFMKYCKGVIVGYFFLCTESISENNRPISDMVLEYTANNDFPIIEIKELGHAVENLIIPIGGDISIDASESNVVLSGSFEKE